MKILEIRDVKYVNQVLAKDIETFSHAPVVAYVQGGNAFMSAFRPKVLADFYLYADIGGIAADSMKSCLPLSMKYDSEQVIPLK